MYPYPTFTEEEYKAAEREMNKGIKSAKKNGKKKSVKAAHRIDLDDDGQVEAAAETSEPKAVKPSGIVPPAALKDESDKETDN